MGVQDSVVCECVVSQLWFLVLGHFKAFPEAVCEIFFKFCKLSETKSLTAGGCP